MCSMCVGGVGFISVSDVTVSLSVVSELLMSSVSSVTCVLSAFLMSHFVLLNSIPDGIVKSCVCIHMCVFFSWCHFKSRECCVCRSSL